MRSANRMFRQAGATSWVAAFAGMTAVVVMCLPMSPAAAFDCAKAGTAVERAICADAALKQLDDALGSAYVARRQGLDAAQQAMLGLSQRRWIARRELCSAMPGDVTDCVTARTAERLALLSGKPLSGPGSAGALVPAVLVQEGSPTTWDIDIAVLRFAEPRTAGEQTLNRLADQVLGSATLGPHGQPEQSAVLTREDRFSLTYASPGFMSVRHDFYLNEGGAHGNHGTENFNIDMASGRLLAAADVLAEPPAALLTLWCKSQIEAEKLKRVPDIDLGADAAARDATIAAQVRDLSRWSIGEKDIVVSFDPYAVGAYAEGSYECRFPTAGVKELARDGVPLP